MENTSINLVPDCINPSPDYYCTWQVQLYATCDGKPAKQRAIIGEKGLFDKEKPYGWAYFYDKARRDLILVMDDSWDVPLDGDSSYYGSLVLNSEKFPEATKNVKTNSEALKNLVDRVKLLGWKGLGGWVCVQEADRLKGNSTPEEYWTKRVCEANESGFSYWKVDWGEKQSDTGFRRMQTELARKYAPDLIIEHAVVNEIIPHVDVFRTYDVPAIMSIPMTLKKLQDILSYDYEKGNGKGLVDCEDEVYIAAAGGFAMGVMRHPYTGAFTDGREDMSFPSVHRNLKTKMFEVIRAVRWHRIAPAFSICNKSIIDDRILTDYWNFESINEEIEAWWLEHPFFSKCMENNTVKMSAPAQIARNCALVEVIPDKSGNIPYIVTSKNPNGAFSVATLGRTYGRIYEIPKCKVTITTEDAEFIGIFGEYEELEIKTDLKDIKKVHIQDLAADMAYDITEQVKFDIGKVIIPGILIHEIGTSAQPDEDTSEPGVVIKLSI